jgi:RND family efflux transporter MFP subunit
MIYKILKSILRRKLLTGIILLLVIGGIYFGYQKLAGEKNGVQYVTAAVEKGTLIVSVSGSGQVAVSDQIDIKPKVSGDVVYVGVETNQEVRPGTLITQLDTRDAEKVVQDAEINLASARTALENLKNTKRKAEESLTAAYNDGLNILTNTFEDLSPRISDLEKMFTDSSYDGDENDIDYYIRLVRTYSKDSEQLLSYWDNGTEKKYLAAKNQFDRLRSDYFMLTLNSPPKQIETILNQTYDFTQVLLDLVRQGYNLAQKYQTIIETENIIPPISAETTNNHASQLSEFTSLLISRVNSLSSAKQSLKDKKEAVEKADSDIEDQIYVIEQREDALFDAKEKLAQHYIYAPFGGLIAKVNVKKGDAVSSGTTLATVITKQKIAEISLNEVDAAKVKVGQKATLTFDALPEVSISGKILEVDTLGTVTQGVVSYGVKITFDTEEEKVKPGMSVTADIITDSKQDVLVLPNGAIKSQGNSYYVELVEASEEMKQQLLTNTSGTILPTPPKQQQVETGLSNDLSTEIVSGLKEGDIVVTSTISPNKIQTTQTQTTQTRGNQGFQIPEMINR